MAIKEKTLRFINRKRAPFQGDCDVNASKNGISTICFEGIFCLRDPRFLFVDIVGRRGLRGSRMRAPSEAANYLAFIPREIIQDALRPGGGGAALVGVLEARFGRDTAGRAKENA